MEGGSERQGVTRSQWRVEQGARQQLGEENGRGVMIATTDATIDGGGNGR